MSGNVAFWLDMHGNRVDATYSIDMLNALITEDIWHHFETGSLKSMLVGFTESLIDAIFVIKYCSGLWEGRCHVPSIYFSLWRQYACFVTDNPILLFGTMGISLKTLTLGWEGLQPKSSLHLSMNICVYLIWVCGAS